MFSKKKFEAMIFLYIAKDVETLAMSVFIEDIRLGSSLVDRVFAQHA